MAEKATKADLRREIAELRECGLQIAKEERGIQRFRPHGGWSHTGNHVRAVEALGRDQTSGGEAWLTPKARG